jgi:glutathione S-transferase
MYTLYYSPGACSMAVHVILNELALPFELNNAGIATGHNRSPEFLKVNPRGQVPVLQDNDLIIREGAAILLHLLEKHHSPLLPQSGTARTTAIEWLMFGNATLHPAYARVFFLLKNAPDGEVKNQLTATAVAMINKLWAEVETRLEASPYLAGDNVTAADILITVIANWSLRMPHPVTIGARTKQLLQKIIARPAYHKALETEQVEYKAAA